MTERAGEPRGTGTVILASAQLVALTLTLLSRIGHTVPGPIGWSYAIAVGALIGIAAGAVLAVGRPADWSVGTARLWYGPVAFALLVVVTELGPVTETRWLAVPLVAVGTGVVLVAAGDVLVTATGVGSLRSSRGVVVGGLIGLAGAGVVIAQGTPPLVWVVLIGVGYAATVAVAGFDLRPGLVGVLLVPVLAVGPSAMDDSAIRTPASSLEVTPTLTGTADLVIDNVPTGDIRDAWSWERNNPYVGAPYALQRTFDRILVLDAGGGNAVGRALAAEPNRVDAVEADRGLVSAARRFRPDRAYADSRVTVHEQDPRAALRRLSEPYDLIVVARADPRLLTTSAMDRIKGLLEPSGIYAMHDTADDYLRPAARAARAAFGHEPCVSQASGGFAVIAAVDPGRQSCASAGAAAVGDPPTDNRPFTSVETGRRLLIAGLAAAALTVLAVLVVLAGLVRFVRAAGGASSARRFVPPALVGLTAALHAVAATPVLRNLPIEDWALPMVLLAGWLVCLLPALTRPVRARPTAVAVAILLALVLLGSAVVPTDSLSFAGVAPRLGAAAAIVGLPILLGAVLLTGTANRSTGDLLGGVIGGVAVGATLAGTVGLIGHSGLLVVAAVPALGYAIIVARRRTEVQALSTVE